MIPWVGGALLALDLLEALFRQAGNQRGFNPGNWTVRLRCGPDGNYWSSRSGWSTCEQTPPSAIFNADNGFISPTATTVYTGTTVPHPTQPATYQRMTQMGAIYDKPKTGESIMPSGGKPAYLPSGPEVPGARPRPDRRPPGSPEAPPRPGIAPAESPWAAVDPMSRPPGVMAPMTFTLPFSMLPKRIENDWRSPVEQSKRGNVEPVAPWAPETVPTVDPAPNPRPKPQEAPRPSPWPGGWPTVEDLPGWVAQPLPQPVRQPEAPPVTVERPGQSPGPSPGPGPGIEPRPEPLPPVVREEWPKGAAGPTITYGPVGPPIGPHTRKAPERGTKERKGRMKAGAILRLATKGKKVMEEVADAIDALDCVYGALPKGLRWEIQKASFAKQRAEGKVPRPGAKIDQSNAPQVDLGFVGLDGQSLTIPGSVNTRNPQYADLNANYIQPLTPQEKAAAVYRHAAQIDLDAAVKCMVANEIEDRVIGAQSRYVEQAARKQGKLTGYETGITF